MQPKPRILVIRGGAIGDFILTLPAIRLLREAFPGSHVEVLGYPGIADLAVAAGLADAARNLEHRTMAPLFARGAPIDEELAGYLRGFNLVVSYLYDPDAHFRDSLSRAGVRSLLVGPHKVVPGPDHASVQLAKPLEALALYADAAAPEWRRPFFAGGAGTAAAGARARVAIHPGSGSEAKNWPEENWMALGRELARQRGDILLTLITGEAEAERGAAASVLAGWKGLRFDHWHGVPLPELARRLPGCAAFFGHDSGISHLAAACGVPCLLLFGPTEPALWAPPQEKVAVVRAEAGCLASLPVQTVLSRVRDFLPSRPTCDRPVTC